MPCADAQNTAHQQTCGLAVGEAQTYTDTLVANLQAQIDAIETGTTNPPTVITQFPSAEDAAAVYAIGFALVFAPWLIGWITGRIINSIQLITKGASS